MQPAVDQIVKLCVDADLAVKKNIHGRNYGFHPSNRARTGVYPFNAQDLALKISKQAYSETKLRNPISFENAASAQVYKCSSAHASKCPMVQVSKCPSGSRW